ncbi:hypothetical protein BN946_scf184792.g3 [Trametes cinnabarina]|uniref:DUF6532 domain-containing protein n=1 Tax=Pycnoporus cinnabarinus TaxID=5643 RepID=A0A060SNP6_PYCCI|nr:hypothetical protein BN946_scf184792.g3 [Trametes cinnabarina]
MDVDINPSTAAGIANTQRAGQDKRRKRAQSTSVGMTPNQAVDPGLEKLQPTAKKLKKSNIPEEPSASLTIKIPVAATTDQPVRQKQVGPPKSLSPINSDESSPEPEDARKSAPAVTSVIKAGTTSRSLESDREDGVNDEGEDVEDGEQVPEGGDELEEPESHEEGDLSNLATEAVSFRRVFPASSRATSVDLPQRASDAAVKTPTWHKSSSAEPIQSQTPADRRVNHKQSVRERKLAEEMPSIPSRKPLARQRDTRRVLTWKNSDTDGDNADDADDIDNISDNNEDRNTAADDESTPWLAHTDISNALRKASANTYSLSLSHCGPEIRRVMQTSFERGKAIIALGDGTDYLKPEQVEGMHTPFEARGLDRIAISAIIAAAEDLGYGNAYDIADRLERGSEQKYIAPMRAYTAQRLRIYRADIKRAAASAYPAAIGLSTMSREALRELHASGNFLYPRLANGDFQYAQPFAGPGVVEVVRAAFFGTTSNHQIGSENINKFTSSLASSMHELEIPALMLAMAAAAVSNGLTPRHDITNLNVSRRFPMQINSVLLDNTDSSTSSSEFAGSALDNAFKAYMKILVQLRIKNVQRYHALMHGICMAVTGGNAINLHGNATQNDILANVDWDAIVDDSLE